MKKIIINSVFVFFAILVLAGNVVIAQEEVKSQEPKINNTLLEKWKSLLPEEKELLRERHKALKNMTPQQRQALKENSDKFKQLPLQKQEALRNNWQRIKGLSLDERKAISNNYRRWRNLSPQEREGLRQRYKRLQQLNPDERQRFLERQKKWQSLPPGEKENLRRQHIKHKDVSVQHPALSERPVRASAQMRQKDVPRRPASRTGPPAARTVPRTEPRGKRR